MTLLSVTLWLLKAPSDTFAWTKVSVSVFDNFDAQRHLLVVRVACYRQGGELRIKLQK